MAAGLMDDERTAIAEYQEALTLMPGVYEARIGIAISQRRAGHLGAAGATLLEAATRARSLPARQKINDLRAYLYRDLRDRKSVAAASEDAFLAQRELHLRHPDPFSRAILTFNARSLGIVLEEVGEFTKAEKYFAESVMWSYDEKVSEAVRFEADLGHARSLRKLGNPDAATKTCNEWRRRLDGIHSESDNAHWGGRSIVQARWEFSCGSFERGIQLVRAELQRHPTSDTPYLALEEGYRSRGDSALADQAHALSEKVRTAHDRAILGAILSEVDDLARRGNVTAIEK
jgi:tetratricopeptide (TPR) repeat protein